VRRTSVRLRTTPRFPCQDEKFLVSELETNSVSSGVSGWTLDIFLEEVCTHYSLESLQELVGHNRKASEARGVAAKLAMEAGICTLTELGGMMERDVSTFSSAAERIRAREKRERQIAERVAALSEQLAQLQA